MKPLKLLRTALMIDLLIVVALLLWFVGYLIADPSTSSKSYKLPTENQIAQIHQQGYIYASDDDLQKILFNVDIQLKTQGLSSDGNSEVFDSFTLYDKSVKQLNSSSNGQGQINNVCTEFKYFDNKDHAATLTLLPISAQCFTNDTALQEKIANLHAKYDFVYALCLH